LSLQRGDQGRQGVGDHGEAVEGVGVNKERNRGVAGVDAAKLFFQRQEQTVVLLVLQGQVAEPDLGEGPLEGFQENQRLVALPAVRVKEAQSDLLSRAGEGKGQEKACEGQKEAFREQDG